MTTTAAQGSGRSIAQQITGTLWHLWNQWSDLEQDVTVYCQSSSDRLFYATLTTLGALLICAWLFWRLRLF